MKFLLRHVYIKGLRPSSSSKPEAYVQECEVQTNVPLIHSSFSSSNAKVNGDRVNELSCVSYKWLAQM